MLLIHFQTSLQEYKKIHYTPILGLNDAHIEFFYRRVVHYSIPIEITVRVSSGSMIPSTHNLAAA